MILLLACAAAIDEPVADIGPDRHGHPGIPYVFDAADSVGDEIHWSLGEVPPNTRLTDADIVIDGTRAWIEPDAEGNYEIVLEVCNGLHCARDVGLASAWDIISGAAPTADAGADQSVTLGDSANIDASGSTDPEGDTLTYTWRFKSVPASSTLVNGDIDDRFAATTFFDGDVAGTYELRVFVDDGTTTKADVTAVTYTASSNSAPVVDAGSDQTGAPGDVITFDGSGTTDADGDTLKYRWGFKSIPASSALSNADWTDRYTTAGNFEPDVAGTYEVRFAVNDGVNAEVLGFVDAVISSGSNSPPVCDAGPDVSLPLGTDATQDGSGSSDPDGDTLKYRWGFKSVPSGSALGNTDWTDRYTTSGTFTPDVTGTYELRFACNDKVNAEELDFVDVTVTASNTAPIADAGADQEAVLGDTVSLDGTGSSDPDGDPLTYAWVFTVTPTGSSLANTDISDRFTTSASFTPDVAGDYELKFKVDDGTVLSRDWIDITIHSHSYDDVQAIFDANCTSCHSGTSPSAGMDLSGDAYSTIVDVASDDVASMDLVEPFDSANSYLFHKIAGTQSSVGGSGQQMPRGASPLSTSDQTLIETWIDEGATDL